jgi:hypothetical protein
MSYQGGDFGFVGQSYTAPNPWQDRQQTLNYYVELSQDDKSKTATALLGCPGLNPLFSVADGPSGGEVRGCWVLPGGTRAIAVCGNNCAMITMTVPATQTSIAQFSVEIFGSLLTNNGPVCIRDNGAEGDQIVIVDGPYGYTVNMTGTPVLTQITDPGFLGADRVAFIDGWLIFNQPDTQVFYTTGPTPYTVTFPGSFFALKDSSSDNLITLMENNRELWLIGERTSEVWYNAGGANFAFSRVPGVAPQIGCSAVNSIARLGSSLVWLGSSERGENVVIQTEQYSYKDISTRAVEAAISSYPYVADAIGFVYEEEGHLFYVLTFPTADKTWCYDVASGGWHERASFTPATAQLHRVRANCFMNFQNLRMVGDFESGYIHQMSRKVYTDAGFDPDSGLPTTTPLVARRRSPIIWSRENRKRMFHGSLQVDFAPGVGLQSGQGVNPQAMLRWSDDAGESFGNEHWTSIGKVGRYKNRALWRRLGQARDRVYEVTVTDPVQRDIVGATLFAQGEVEMG